MLIIYLLFEVIFMDKIVISVEQMRRSDAYTIENFVPSKELMYRAANGVFESFRGWENKKIAIVVGGGNNGGDGYALAGILKKNNIDSVIIKVSEKMSEDGKYYFDIAEELGVKCVSFMRDTDLSSYDVIVDCILGTGFTGDVRGLAKDAIEAINESGAYVISVDINSGMNGDTGEASLAVKSDLTVSIGYYKQGLFTDSAKEYIKEMTNVDIGIVLV
jgi:NAD(P)H-hydrate epimerase